MPDHKFLGRQPEPGEQPAAPFVSYAQNFEDVMLWRALKHVERGFYIDVGASEPEADSVTLAFYERGWTGINLEPAPGAFARLSVARVHDINLNVAAGTREGEADFLLVDGGNGLSTLRTESQPTIESWGWTTQATTVRVRRLGDICRDHRVGDIHFLKVDAEGAERDVLEGADLTVWRPWLVVVEATGVNTTVPTHHLWEDLLLTQRYRMVYADGLNRFYLAAEHEELAAAFGSPPNVFDQFVRAADLRVQRERADRVETLLADAQHRAEAAQVRAEIAQNTLLGSHDRALAAATERDAALAIAERAETAMKEAAQRHAGLLAERDAAVQELWESNRLVGALANDRQKLVDLGKSAAIHDSPMAAAELAAVYASTSWRISAPLRALGRLGRR